MRSDPELLRALGSREDGAFEELFARYRERIWRFLARLAGDRATAEDLFQETWFAAARHAERLREDTQLLRWLYTIAHNKHRNARRGWAAEWRRRTALAGADPGATPPPDAAAASRVEAQRVAAAFSRLPEAHREVLLLCACEGLEAEDAAEVLGVSAEAVRKRLSRARAELAEIAGRERAAGGGPR
jgi:RNA polymerase sigma-70 factor (ECF subfamily)